jgi:hypothetical protein
MKGCSYLNEADEDDAMECQVFNEVLIELACELPLETEMRKLALAHTGQCGYCSQRLAIQRELNARMLEFSRATGSMRVPASVREQLRTAVADLRSAQPPVSAPKRDRMSWALAAAAMIFILLLSAAVWRYLAKASGQNGPAENPSTLTKSPARQEQPAVAVEPSSSRRADDKRRARRNVRDRQIRRAADRVEVASDFVPLTPAMDQKAIENGMIVRLEVSRSKLIAMGLPLHMEGDGETINTEVVMGDNGVAYAIRVVR